ncbi:putative threonine efflux protein [Saprospira grandis DSM 2844]|uniref:Putative threonine efflux protein n=1 Tax=Saprospira grandis DSM 2844 TaxID=694433 RepID=J1I5I4_9BACT|nr:LysE family transporter [Saprospira grandis]EJF54040.1 putative threonine efflux protein [Saprospira grandis DSM 2844]
MLTQAILEGLGLGLLLSIMTGPIFFTILQVSIEKGSRSGIALVAGQWISDFIYIGISSYLAKFLISWTKESELGQDLEFYLSIGGGAFLILLGLLLLFSPLPKAKTKEKPLSNKQAGQYFLQGFLINSLTPFPLFFWFTSIGTAYSRGYSQTDLVFFGVAIMLMVILTDFLKVFLASRLRQLLNELWLKRIRWVASFGLIISGLLFWLRLLWLS